MTTTHHIPGGIVVPEHNSGPPLSVYLDNNNSSEENRWVQVTAGYAVGSTNIQTVSNATEYTEGDQIGDPMLVSEAPMPLMLRSVICAPNAEPVDDEDVLLDLVMVLYTGWPSSPPGNGNSAATLPSRDQIVGMPVLARTDKGMPLIWHGELLLPVFTTSKDVYALLVAGNTFTTAHANMNFRFGFTI